MFNSGFCLAYSLFCNSPSPLFCSHNLSVQLSVIKSETDFYSKVNFVEKYTITRWKWKTEKNISHDFTFELWKSLDVINLGQSIYVYFKRMIPISDCFILFICIRWNLWKVITIIGFHFRPHVDSEKLWITVCSWRCCKNIHQ